MSAAGERVRSTAVPIIVITGGSGRIGSMLRQRLARPGRTLRLLDITPPASPGPDEEVVVASVTDMAAMAGACAGADAVIHLGGVSGEGPWDKIIEINIQGTYTVFEAARRAGVPRVIFASSNHAVGFTPRVRLPRPGLRVPRAGHLLRGVQGDGGGAGLDVPRPLRDGRDLPAHPVLLRAPGRAPGCSPPGCPRTTPGGCSRPA